MRVLWIHQNYVGSTEAGNSRAELVVNSFLDAGWEVDLICSNETYFGHERESGQDHRIGLHMHCLDLNRRNGNRLEKKKLSYFKFCYRSIAYLGKLNKPDIVFCSSPPLPQVFAGIVAAQYFKAKFITEVRDLWPAFLIEGRLIRSRILAKALYWLEALFYRSADHCIAVSPGFYPYLREMGIAESQITTAPTAENTTIAFKSDQSWRDRNNLSKSFLVLYAGSMNESYDIQLIVDTAVNTINKDKNIVWIFAGDGREAFKVKEVAKEHEQILYLGNIPKTEIISIMHSCDVGINSHAKWPLLDTVITGKLIDYLSTSLPVVSSSQGIIEQILAHSGAGITTPHNADAMSKAILQLKKLAPEELDTLGEKGKTWLGDHIDPKQMQVRIQSLVNNSLSHVSFSEFKIIGSIIGAFKDVIIRKAEKAMFKCYSNEVRQAVLQKAFSDWILGVKKS